MIGTSEPDARSSRARSRPSPSGSIRSSSTRSSSPRASAARASASVPQTTGSNPSRASALENGPEIDSSSSTNSTRGFTPPRLGRKAKRWLRGIREAIPKRPAPRSRLARTPLAALGRRDHPASTASRTSSKRLRYGADACRWNASNSARMWVLTVSIETVSSSAISSLEAGPSAGRQSATSTRSCAGVSAGTTRLRGHLGQLGVRRLGRIVEAQPRRADADHVQVAQRAPVLHPLLVDERPVGGAPVVEHGPDAVDRTRSTRASARPARPTTSAMPAAGERPTVTRRPTARPAAARRRRRATRRTASRRAQRRAAPAARSERTRDDPASRARQVTLRTRRWRASQPRRVAKL